MDTVGDAYIVAAWLKDDGEVSVSDQGEDTSHDEKEKTRGAVAKFNQELARKMLWCSYVIFFFCAQSAVVTTASLVPAYVHVRKHVHICLCIYIRNIYVCVYKYIARRVCC